MEDQKDVFDLYSFSSSLKNINTGCCMIDEEDDDDFFDKEEEEKEEKEEKKEKEKENFNDDDVVLPVYKKCGISLKDADEIAGLEPDAEIIKELLEKSRLLEEEKTRARRARFTKEWVDEKYFQFSMPELHKERFCSVCFCTIMCKEKVRRLRCNHIFHSDCILDWILLGSADGCPDCRIDF